MVVKVNVMIDDMVDKLYLIVDMVNLTVFEVNLMLMIWVMR